MRLRTNQFVSQTVLHMLTALLEATRDGPVSASVLPDRIRVTGDTLNGFLDEVRKEGLIQVENGEITQDISQRLATAVKAVQVGADVEAVSRCLTWLEFEELSARVFEENGFKVMRRFRFMAEGRRWELDLLAVRTPYLVCGECKRWGKGIGNQTARGIIETHLEKIEVFTGHIEELRKRVGLVDWSKAVVVPMVLTLSATPMEIYRRVPSVSVLALPSFLSEFDGQLERLAHFRTNLKPLEPKLKQTVLRRRKVNDSRRARR
ncbi:hypothetical protein A3K78_08830 [Candidatus Bathyarchaeota archaeon RBG_13_52_12]|nr:MAG: hypothetical protein A3K78_08830 [Candidatus Bathyarchaeota archaeon RBG_13_52_12]